MLGKEVSTTGDSDRGLIGALKCVGSSYAAVVWWCAMVSSGFFWLLGGVGERIGGWFGNKRDWMVVAGSNH